MAAVIVFPAIDLKNGACVRLKRGEMESATFFNADPAAQARAFETAGFEWLHCVDLNGAFEGRSVNADAIKAIRDAVSIPVQLGGGIRDRDAIEFWLATGMTRVILGTAALHNPELVKEGARAHPGRIVVGIDTRDGKVAVEGWARSSEISAPELARRFEDAGVAAIILTDIARDGMLQGVNAEATDALARAVNVPVVASGGVASLADIQALAGRRNPNIAGVIVGRALYDGRIDPAEALRVARGS